VSSAPVRVGVIGCGTISKIYLENARKLENLDVVACADVIPERAQVRAAEFDVPKACSVAELLADPSVEIALNLTIPRVHAEVSLAALEAGKSVYSEKPLAITRADGQRLLKVARARGLLVGCAPDTFLGGGIQTCRKLIGEGAIGEPVAALAFFMSHGPESWHPDPDFYYQPGAGPLFDMGPYYLTTLIALIGPIRRVTASARITFPERAITSQPKQGTKISVNVPTHVAGVADFANGPIGTIVTSFDVWPSDLPRIQIFGTEATLTVPDPNTFGGPVRIRRAGDREWTDVPLSHGNVGNSRGIGLADMARALRTGASYRATGELAYHVLDAMQGFVDASEMGTHVELASSCRMPDPLPTDDPIQIAT
jgi:predicted dehydrogenase